MHERLVQILQAFIFTWHLTKSLSDWVEKKKEEKKNRGIITVWIRISQLPTFSDCDSFPSPAGYCTSRSPLPKHTRSYFKVLLTKYANLGGASVLRDATDNKYRSFTLDVLIQLSTLCKYMCVFLVCSWRLCDYVDSSIINCLNTHFNGRVKIIYVDKSFKIQHLSCNLGTFVSDDGRWWLSLHTRAHILGSKIIVW